ncbi:MAG: HepT-like ribonuclease domain-containing protein [Acidimicrobiales bacterium]
MKGIRIVVDHAYHGIDYERVWRTLRDDVPELDRVVRRWIGTQRDSEIDLPAKERKRSRDKGDDLGIGL